MTRAVEKNAHEGNLLSGHRILWLPICASMRTRPGRVEPDVYSGSSTSHKMP